ncbi:sulfotransferase [Mesorhizobium sp. M4B.F.Ca.ET.017.02.2.1]|uniref:sulfotransferase family protein n=1 Tax=Mesorhizobium sp. M4B.F.Ca.ET.017.02.2.1 TaxID=2496649 RepID=UPI000FCA88D5|nr:sulfotransferase [Mesorhizobium sp. M4B.F.Ca.ET.017.02.2.1]RVD20671.1 hypothetical protein EN738_21660 [Mesorhizobium sp. M4B.F.Ca.ET.017.02.2.1]
MNKHPSPEQILGATPGAQPALQAAPKKRAKAKPAKRTCIMVLGMHRSGTSALTRAISLLGAELPKNMLGSNPSNPTGHWEPQRLIDLHERMLAEAGSRWDDWRPFNPDDLGSERLQFYKAEIARLIDEEYGSASLFVIKEPRISRFVPLYADILERMRIDVRYVLIERNPLAVIASLAARDGFTAGFSSLLWLRHELGAEHATRGRPRLFLSYEGLLDDWRPGIEAVTNALGIDWPLPKTEWHAPLAGHFSKGQQHHVAGVDQLEADSNVDAWIKQTYGAMRALGENEADDSAMLRLDAVRAAFDSHNPVFGEAFFSELSAREKAAAAKIALQRRAIDEQTAELERNRAEAIAGEAQLTEQSSDLARLAEGRAMDIEKIRMEAAAREADLQVRVDREASRAYQAERRILAAAEELEGLRAEIGKIRKSLSWKVTYPARYLKSMIKK